MPPSTLKQITHWLLRDRMTNTCYGKISNLVWCQAEATRMNEASARRVVVAEKDGYVCITADRVCDVERAGGKCV
jgi:hypothetical protein